MTFKVKNYRVEGQARYTTMTLAPAEFIRRVLIHVLPKGFHRIRHYVLLATGTRVDNTALAKKLLGNAETEITELPGLVEDVDGAAATEQHTPSCPCCSGRMRIIETFLRGETPRHTASPRPSVIRIDTS